MASSAGLPENLHDVYSRYKRDTEVIAGWLVEQATKTGYKRDDTPAAVPDNGSQGPKLKGRARKLVRDAAKSTPSVKYKYITQPAEFVAMANRIVNSKARIQLPYWMQIVFGRTIKARRAYTKWFSDQKESSKIDNDKHEHFTNILHTTLTLLKPCWQPRPEIAKSKPDATPANKASRHTSDTGLRNRFEHLEVEETTSSEFIGQSEIESMLQKEEKRATKAHIVLDESELETEFIFAIWSFLAELSRIRVVIANKWLGWLKGDIELMEAGLLTNTAIDLVRRAEADFELSLKRPAKYPVSQYPTEALPMIIFYMHANGLTKDPKFNPRMHQMFVMCGCPICSFTMYIPYTVSKVFSETMADSITHRQNAGAPEISLPQFVLKELCTDPNFVNETNPNKVAQEKLVEALPELISMAILHKDQFLEDEIVHAARHLYENKTVPLWVSFAFGIHLDITDLRTIFGRDPVEDLRVALKSVKERCDSHYKWMLSSDCSEGSKQDHSLFEEVMTQFWDWIVAGKYGLMRSPAERLRWFPATCASMKLQIFLEASICGLEVLNRNRHVIMMAHLYNATRLADPTLPRWPDMELFIAVQGPENLFVGGVPKNMVDAVKKLSLACGMRPVKDNRRNAHEYQYRLGRLRHAQLTSITNNLYGRLCGHGTRKVDEVAHALQQLLHDASYAKFIARLTWDDGNAKGKLLHQMPKTKSATASLSGSTAMETIEGLSLAFVAEFPAFVIDSHSLHRLCWEMFDDIHQHMELRDRDDSSMTIGRGDWDLTHNPINITRTLLTSAANGEFIAATIQKQKNKIDMSSGCAAKAYISMISKSLDPEMKDSMLKMADKIKRQGTFSVMAEFIDSTKGGSVSFNMLPATTAIKKMYKLNRAAKELQALKRLQNDTSYGKFVFAPSCLQALFGPGREREWHKLHETSQAETSLPQGLAQMNITDLMELEVLRKIAFLVKEAEHKEKIEDRGMGILTKDHLAQLTKELEEKTRKQEALATKVEDDDGLGSWFG